MILSSTGGIYLLCAAMTATHPAVGDQDPFNGAVEALRFSFENDARRPYDGDKDFDGQPDGWSRRRGNGFPSYIATGIDRKHARDGRQSLLFKVNGGQAVTYSPVNRYVGRIDAEHSYIFQGFIRTQRLKHDAALISVSFLNARRQRVQRFLTRPVGGTHADWVRVRIPEMKPRADVRFVVIGCHLVHDAQGEMDIHGRVWFDDLRLGAFPQLSLISNFHTHFVEPSAPIEIRSRVSGLDGRHAYRLRMKLIDGLKQTIAETTRDLSAVRAPRPGTSETEPTGRRSEVWKLLARAPGFYRVTAALDRDGVTILSQEATFAVMNIVGRVSNGTFGWSVAHGAGSVPLSDLADVAKQAGINWLKLPVWRSAFADRPQQSADISAFLETLTRHNIVPVGLLNDPPDDIRRKFAKDWTGVSEIFTMRPAFWTPFVDPVIARYSSNVRYWQLGGDEDGSFVGRSGLSRTLTDVKSAFDRIGRDTRIGLRWNWKTPLPTDLKRQRSFLSINGRDPNDPSRAISSEELTSRLKQSRSAGIPRWVVLKPLARSRHSQEERGSDLVMRMVAAKIGGADAIFAYDVFDPEHGLLNSSGSPTPLFLPWRTTALALQGARFLGSITMPKGSRNYVFARENEAVLIVWNPVVQTEELYLGEQAVATDVWGRTQSIATISGSSRQRLEIGPLPLVIRGCSLPVARWRMAVRFTTGKVRSAHGTQTDAVTGTNAFSQGVSGKITLNFPRPWDVDPRTRQLQIAAGEPFKVPVRLALPPNTSLGSRNVSLDFDIAADRQYRFRVYRPYRVGLGDVEIEVVETRLDDGRLQIEQIITNKTSPLETLSFNCSLFAPGQRRQKAFVTKLGKGRDRKFYYLPHADALRGTELWLRADQEGGSRVLNYRWAVGQNMNKPKKKPGPPAVSGNAKR